MPTDQKVLEAIAKTGFVLEHEVVVALQLAGWKTINGSYYIDDVSNQARELDIIAYKITKLDDLHVLTCALISCKKDAKDTAAFLSRKRPSRDPNADWEPAPLATRLQPMKAHLSSSDWKSRYFSSMSPPVKSMLVAGRDVFAFQMVGNEGQANNNKPYYDSFTSLIKALDHELSKRIESNKTHRKRIYSYSLHTVFDARMVEVQFDQEEKDVRPVDRITCFTRYMVRKQDTVASVHFVQSTSMAKWIADLDSLHQHNIDFFEQEVGASFEAIVTSAAVRSYFKEDMGYLLRHYLGKAASRLGVVMPSGEAILGVNERGLEISMDFSESDAEKLGTDATLGEELASLFSRRARYSGNVEIGTFDIPF